jgi:hypothetical protein
MRRPTVNAAPEAKRVRDARDAARDALYLMIRHLRSQPKAVEKMNFVIRFLNYHADGNKLSGEYESAPLDQVVSFLQECQLPLRPRAGRPEEELRNFLLADIIEDICCEFDFHATRGDAAKSKGKQFNEAIGTRQSVCSIIATEWRELESEVRENREPRRTPLIEQGFAPLNRLFRNGFPAWAKARRESTLEGIWDESGRAAKARMRKAKTRAKTR